MVPYISVLITILSAHFKGHLHVLAVLQENAQPSKHERESSWVILTISLCLSILFTTCRITLYPLVGDEPFAVLLWKNRQNSIVVGRTSFWLIIVSIPSVENYDAISLRAKNYIIFLTYLTLPSLMIMFSFSSLNLLHHLRFRDLNLRSSVLDPSSTPSIVGKNLQDSTAIWSTHLYFFISLELYCSFWFLIMLWLRLSVRKASLRSLTIEVASSLNFKLFFYDFN